MVGQCSTAVFPVHSSQFPKPKLHGLLLADVLVVTVR